MRRDGQPGDMTDVRLRDWTTRDASAITPILEDPEVLKWSHIAELGPAGWIAEQRSGRRGPSLAICETGDDTALGKVALRLPGRASPATSCDAILPTDQPVGELSYWVLPHARGRGIATAAVLAILKVARATEDLRSVVLDIEFDNAASVRVAERIGADRREPTRVEQDRQGVPRTLAVYVVHL